MKKMKAFTLLEVVIICLLLGIGLVTIFQAANRAKIINENITQTIIANQIATEGVEILYQFRNTNFLKHQQRDQLGQFKGTNHRSGNKCWLAQDYEQNNETCDNRLGSGYYYITNIDGINVITGCNDCENTGWDNITLTGDLFSVNIIDDKYAICLKSGVRTPCPEGHEAGGDESKYGKFYRTIRGIGIYNMASNNTGGDSLLNSNISEYDAQEYRFCSMVARKGGENGKIEICSTMTNFIE